MKRKDLKSLCLEAKNQRERKTELLKFMSTRLEKQPALSLVLGTQQSPTRTVVLTSVKRIVFISVFSE